MTPAQAKGFEARLKQYQRDERHLNYNETRYWLNQYRLLASDMVAAARGTP